MPDLTPADYQKAIDSQSACNLSALAHALSEVMPRIWTSVSRAKGGTDDVNTHPIVVLYVVQLAHLAGKMSMDNYMVADTACRAAANPPQLDTRTSTFEATPPTAAELAVLIDRADRDLWYVCADGEAICAECASDCRHDLLDAARAEEPDAQWHVVGTAALVDLLREDEDCRCAHCYASAYKKYQGRVKGDGVDNDCDGNDAPQG